MTSVCDYHNNGKTTTTAASGGSLTCLSRPGGGRSCGGSGDYLHEFDVFVSSACAEDEATDTDNKKVQCYEMTRPITAAGGPQNLNHQPGSCEGYVNEVYMDSASSGDLNEDENFPSENGYGQDQIEERYTSSNESKPESATERVLCQLDEVLREKINLEMESFRRSLHVMLNDQRSNLQHLVRLASLKVEDDDNKERRDDDIVPWDYQGDFQASCSGSGSSQSQTEHTEKYIGFVDNESCKEASGKPQNDIISTDDVTSSLQVKEDKLLCLIKLQTLASVISNNLRRQEYLT